MTFANGDGDIEAENRRLRSAVMELKKQLTEKTELLNKQIQSFNSFQDSWIKDKKKLIETEQERNNIVNALGRECKILQDELEKSRREIKEIFRELEEISSRDFDYNAILYLGTTKKSKYFQLKQKYLGENQSQRTKPQVHGSNVDRRTDEIKSGLVDKTADTHGKSDEEKV